MRMVIWFVMCKLAEQEVVPSLWIGRGDFHIRIFKYHHNVSVTDMFYTEG